jgi:hypothetical protein
MEAKILRPNQMHLVDAFHAAGKAEAALAEQFNKALDNGTVDDDLAAAVIEPQRATMTAFLAVRNAK